MCILSYVDQLIFIFFFRTEQLSRTNIELHKKIIYLGNYISILEKKIVNLNEIVLLKNISYASLNIENEILDVSRTMWKFHNILPREIIFQSENIETNKKEVQFISNECLKKLRNLCIQLNEIVDDFQIEKSKFFKIIQNKEREVNENSNYLIEMWVWIV